MYILQGVFASTLITRRATFAFGCCRSSVVHGHAVRNLLARVFKGMALLAIAVKPHEQLEAHARFGYTSSSLQLLVGGVSAAVTNLTK